ncbi:M23 family metallopeptidase [Candidatus Daviesbacteria bacterium]|nr:M23 family metallopeptidase [Candidatus Daviesbacteria bacterium]
MKVQNKSLLPKVIFERVALIWKLSKIKPRFRSRFIQLAIIFLILFNLLGYYPTLAIPPVKRAQVLAALPEVRGEVIAQSFSKPLILPHPGYLSTKFSTWHPGIDIAAGLGMPIHPIIDGEVIEVGRDFWGLGNFVVVAHENGFKSTYAHMGKIYVKTGQKITQENTLGEVGITGNTSGPHTHLEVTLNGKYIDPQTILPEISRI